MRVLLFASLREAMGWSEMVVTSETLAATPLALWRQLGLAGAWERSRPAPGAPGSSALPTGLRVAINQRFATADTPLAEGDELAFLPPITGG